MAPSSSYAWVYLDPRFAFKSYCFQSESRLQSDLWPNKKQPEVSGIWWPTEKQLVDALADVYDEKWLDTIDTLFHETMPDMELSCGIKNGPEYRMSIVEGSQYGLISYSKYADWNDEESLWCYQQDEVPYEVALEWWLMLARGQYNLLEEQIPQWTKPAPKRWGIQSLFGK